MTGQCRSVGPNGGERAVSVNEQHLTGRMDSAANDEQYSPKTPVSTSERQRLVQVSEAQPLHSHTFVPKSQYQYMYTVFHIFPIQGLE